MNTPLPLTLRIFLPFAAGYFISYLYRVVNAVIAVNLTADLGIGPSSLGLLTATYFIAFAAAQLPLGVLLDRFGPRKVEALLLLFAAAGAFIFARSHSLASLVLGRALIGFGVSACLMAAFKAYTLWFAADRWPLVNGFQMAAGGLGALAATAPVEAALAVTDWRGVFLALALITLAVAAAVMTIVPQPPAQKAGQERLATQLAGIRTIFTSLDFWCIAPLTTMSQAAMLSIQGLWAGPWLKDVAGLDRPAVAAVLFWVAVAMIAGFILLGSLAQKLDRHGIGVAKTAVTGMTVFLGLQVAVAAAPTGAWTTPVWMSFGFFGTSGILAYAALSQRFPVALSGRVTTAINLLVFIAAFAGQWAIGAIIGLWPATATGGYALAGYRTGFGMLSALQLLTLGWYFVGCRIIARRTHRRDTQRKRQ